MTGLSNLENFISDVVSTMKEQYDESQEEMLNDPKDQFNSGRALAYQEIYDIIATRLKIYEIKIES